MGEAQVLVLLILSKEVLDCFELDFPREYVALAGAVEFKGVLVHYFHAVHLIIHFAWVYLGRNCERCIHCSSPAVGKIGAGEIDKAIEQEDDCIFITVAVAALCGVKIGMGIAYVCICVADYAAEHASGCVRGKAHNKVAQNVLPGLDFIEGLQPIKVYKEIIHEVSHPGHIVHSGCGDNNILAVKRDYLVCG